MSKKKPAGCELREVTSQLEQGVRINSTAIDAVYRRHEELVARVTELEQKLFDLSFKVNSRRPFLARWFKG